MGRVKTGSIQLLSKVPTGHALIDATFVIVFSVVAWSAQAAAEQRPGVNERLNEGLGDEGGVQVYQDEHGNVGTVIDQTGGERQVTVQPPQSPSINLGPPLQLHQRPFMVPPAINPGLAPAPEFPQKRSDQRGH